MGLDEAVHPDASVADDQRRTWARPQAHVLRANPSSSRTKPVSTSAARRRHRVRALTARLTTICSEAGGTAQAAGRGVEAGGQGDVLADEAAEHRLHAADDLVQVDDARLHHCLRLKARSCRVRAEARWAVFLHQLDVAAERLSGGGLSRRKLASFRDHGQEIVEVVGSRRGRAAPDRLHLLGVEGELRLERPHGGEVRTTTMTPRSWPSPPLSVAITISTGMTPRPAGEGHRDRPAVRRLDDPPGRLPPARGMAQDLRHVTAPGGSDGRAAQQNVAAP